MSCLCDKALEEGEWLGLGVLMRSFHAVAIWGTDRMDYVPIIIIFCWWVVTISYCKSGCQGTKTFFCECFLLLFKGKEIISKAQIELGCQQEGDKVGWRKKRKPLGIWQSSAHATTLLRDGGNAWAATSPHVWLWCGELGINHFDVLSYPWRQIAMACLVTAVELL